MKLSIVTNNKLVWESKLWLLLHYLVSLLMNCKEYKGSKYKNRGLKIKSLDLKKKWDMISNFVSSLVIHLDDELQLNIWWTISSLAKKQACKQEEKIKKLKFFFSFFFLCLGKQLPNMVFFQIFWYWKIGKCFPKLANFSWIKFAL